MSYLYMYSFFISHCQQFVSEHHCNFNLLDETKKSGRRLVGDVHFSEAKTKASWITPVPGG